MIKKKEGFDGQKMIVLPKPIIRILEQDPITSPIHITDIGFFPEARYHFRDRRDGCKQFILIYCAKGKGWIKLRNQEFTINANDFFIIPPNTKHSYSADKDNPWTIYWVHFKGQNSVGFSNKIDVLNRNCNLPPNSSEVRIRLFEEIYQTLDNGYSLDNLQFASMCLWYFLSSFLFAANFKHNYYEKEKDVIDQAIVCFKNNLDKNLSLNTIAGLFNYSTSHFSCLFKTRMGYSPLEYFIRLKIQKACQFLDLTDLRVKEISLKVGYSDPYYFSRLFTKIMHESPNNYRKRQKG